MERKAGNHMVRTVFNLFLCLWMTALISCTREAATILVPPITGSLPAEDTGTLYPMIQRVYPGTLQSLDIPQSYPYDVSPYYPGIVVVFSHLMENDENEMSAAIELLDVTAAQVPVNISSANVSSRYFVVTPAAGLLKQNTEYILRIYKYAAADTSLATATVSRSANRATIVTALAHGLSDNELVTVSGLTAEGYDAGMVPVTIVSDTSFSYDNTGTDQVVTVNTAGIIHIYSRTLVFDNLVIPPATTISPADPIYVEYKFMTGAYSTPDITPPTIAFTNVTDGAVNVDYYPVAGEGYIEIIFNDNKIPMIDPSTVNDQSVTLYDVTNGSAVPGNISFYSTDTDFKTFRFYPYPTTYLLPSTEYRLRICEDPYYVTDFAGNYLTQEDIYFITKP